jgi:sugar lactone lactonase YvrE
MSCPRIFLAAAAVLAIAASPAVPRSFSRMFDGQCFANSIYILAPPFSRRPVPKGAIRQACGNSIAFDPSNGTMAVASGAVFGKLSVSIYHPPFSSASVPAATFTPPGLLHPRQIAWDGAGNLWVADDLARKIYKFRAPFSVSSKAVAVNTVATQPMGLAIDPAHHLMFVGDAGGSRTCAATPCRVYVVPAPYTGAADATIMLGKSTPASLAIDQHGRLFVGTQSGEHTGRVNVYVPPFATGQKAAFTLDAGDRVTSLAFDPAQNLYAQLQHTGGVAVFNGPIARSMGRPSMLLGCPSGVTCRNKNWAGLAFGP